jgi:uncharacterized membrane protein
MNWLHQYRLRLYLRDSIWLFPVLGIGIALVIVALLDRLERTMGWQAELSAQTARTIMATIASSMFSLVVVVSSAVLVAVQLASAQLTPRMIPLVYRNTARRFSLTVFVFTFTFSVAVLVRIEDKAHLLTGYLAAYGFLLNLCFFLHFIDSIGKTVGPPFALNCVAMLGRKVIRTVYPNPFDERHSKPAEPNNILATKPTSIIINSVDGALLAFDQKGLTLLAQQSDCLIELIPQVGDFVAVGDPLFRIYQGGERLKDSELRKCLALAQTRNMDQDPMFAFRIIVDIGSKALSPGINDPTTAVLAIDHLHHLLRDVGGRLLSDGYEKDETGRVRLVYRTPNWDDFVRLSVTELRQYGRSSIQVNRRLSAMLQDLMESLPDLRSPILQRELTLLVASSKREFPDLEDQTLAGSRDLQGIGGSAVYNRWRDQPRSSNGPAELQKVSTVS